MCFLLFKWDSKWTPALSLKSSFVFLELYFMQPKIKTDNNNKKKGNNLNHGLMGSLGFHASGQKYTISKTQGPIFVNFATY
jgi:hypothetical protein